MKLAMNMQHLFGRRLRKAGSGHKTAGSGHKTAGSAIRLEEEYLQSKKLIFSVLTWWAASFDAPPLCQPGGLTRTVTTALKNILENAKKFNRKTQKFIKIILPVYTHILKYSNTRQRFDAQIQVIKNFPFRSEIKKSSISEKNIYGITSSVWIF